MVQKGEIEYNDTNNFEVEAILDMAIQADEVITTYFSLSLISTGHRSLLSNAPALLCGRFSVSCFCFLKSIYRSQCTQVFIQTCKSLKFSNLVRR